MRASHALLLLLVPALLLPPRRARAETLACTPQNEVELRGQVARSVAALRVANYRADAALMRQSSQALEALLGDGGSCPEPMKLSLCDAECHYQRASVYLFRATGLPLLSEKRSEFTEPQSLLAEAQKGLTLLETGIQRLARQQDAGDEQQSFNRFLKDSALLSTLRARLLMAQGDIWYREASIDRVQRLDFLVNEALGDDSPTLGGKGSEYRQAMAYYDEAFWAVMETRTSLPERPELFGPELAELAAVDQDVSQRLQSIRKGFLYLNIDPDDFTLRSIDELAGLLKRQQGELEGLETRIRELTETWAQKFSAQQAAQFDIANAANGRAIDLELHKLGEVQAVTDHLKDDLQQKLGTVNTDLSRLELQRRIHEVEANLQRETLELRNQLAIIQGQKEQDLLALKVEKVHEGMDDLRFNIDMTLAEFNFDMQLQGLELQVKDLENRLQADGNDLKLLDNQEAQTRKQIELEKKRVEQAGTAIQRSEKARDTVFKTSRIPIVQRICAVDAQLQFYTGHAEGFSDPISGVSCTPPQTGEKPSQQLMDDLCKAREQLQNASETDLNDIKACLDGGSCPGGSKNVKRTVEEALAQNKRIHEQERQGYQASIDSLAKLLPKLESIKAQIEDAKSALAKASVASGVMGGIGDAVSGAMSGAQAGAEAGPVGALIGGIFGTLFGAGSAASDAAAKEQERKISESEFEIQYEQLHSEVERQTAEIKNQLEVANKQDAFEAAMEERTLAEINLQRAGLDRELHLVTNEKAAQQLQCKQDKVELEATKARLQAERASYVGELQAKSDETALVAFDIEEQENIRSQSQLELDRLGLELQALGVQKDKVRQDQENLHGMQATLDRQKQTVDVARGKVGKLRQGFDAERAVLANLEEQRKAQTLALSDRQESFIREVIEQAGKASLLQVENLKEQLKGVEGAGQLEQQLLELDSQLHAATLESRKRILALAEQKITNNSEALFWDFENLQASLTRGGPELMDAKRRLLEGINFTYNLYRNRYNMLTRFTADVPAISGDQPFVRNADDLGRLLGSCAGLDSGGTVCHPDSLVWSKDVMTGSFAEFTLDRNSGLVSQLRSEGHVRFEISPFARSEADSVNLGGFVLWKPPMDEEQEMTLVHVVAGLDMACPSQKLTVRHLGLGSRFSRLSPGNPTLVRSLVVQRPTEKTDLPVWSGNDVNRMAEEESKFRDSSYTASTLEQRKLHAPGAGDYPFVGYPLVGTYELIADEQLLDCLAKGAGGSLKLGFIFIRK